MADPNNIQADVPYRTAIAERGKFFPVDTDYLSSIGYPASGEGKYAVLTYAVNTQPFTLSGNITLGAVELKDADTDFRVNIIPLDNSNAVATMIVDASGNQYTFGNLATEATLTGVSGTLSTMETSVSAIQNSLITRLGPTVNLNAVNTNTVGSWVDVSQYHNITVQIYPSTNFGVSAEAATVYLNHSLDGTSWVAVDSANITDVNSVEFSMSNVAYRYINTSVEYSVSASATITTMIYAGN